MKRHVLWYNMHTVSDIRWWGCVEKDPWKMSETCAGQEEEAENRPGIKLLRSWLNKNIKVRGVRGIRIRIRRGLLDPDLQGESSSGSRRWKKSELKPVPEVKTKVPVRIKKIHLLLFLNFLGFAITFVKDLLEIFLNTENWWDPT